MRRRVKVEREENEEFLLDGDDARIPLGDGYYAFIDASDVDRAKHLRWRIGSSGDPITTVPDPENPHMSVYVQLKIVILGERAGRGQAIKNLNGNQLDCRRKNLKLMSLAEARQIDKRILGPIVRAPRVEVNSARRLMGLVPKPKKETLFNRRRVTEELIMLNASIPVSTLEKFRTKCKKMKRSVSDVASEALDDWLTKMEKK